MRGLIRYSLTALLVLVGGAAARADILFIDDVGSAINVYFTTNSAINLSTDLIYTTTTEAVQLTPVTVKWLPTLPTNVNIYDASHTLSDVLQFVTTPTPGQTGYYNVSIDFTSGNPTTAASNAITVTEDGLIHDIGSASGNVNGANYSVDIKFRTAVDPTGVPEPTSLGLVFGAIPVLGLLKRILMA